MGVGYEGTDVEAFLQGLVTWDVKVLVDVRLNAISRKKGFSKRALTENLSGVGIEYLHLPALGNPKENREGFASPEASESNPSHARYKELLRSEPAEDALARLTELALQKRIVVLCFEAAERCCHRRFILEAVKLRIDELAMA